MADSKQANNLTGAYYGPPVPPPRQSYRSVGRGSSCCCGGGPCCLLCTLFKFLLSVVITLGVVVLILWLVFRPNAVKVYVEEASLARFDLSGNGTLAYSLNMTVSVRNPCNDPRIRCLETLQASDPWTATHGSKDPKGLRKHV